MRAHGFREARFAGSVICYYSSEAALTCLPGRHRLSRSSDGVRGLLQGPNRRVLFPQIAAPLNSSAYQQMSVCPGRRESLSRRRTPPWVLWIFLSMKLKAGMGLVRAKRPLCLVLFSVSSRTKAADWADLSRNFAGLGYRILFPVG